MNEVLPTLKFGVGRPVRRKEDEALVRGAGHYVPDIAPAGALQAVVLRSPHAHATFRITDVAAARGMPGVRLILTGDDIGDYGLLPCVFMPPGVKVHIPPYPILAREMVKHVGDAVAFIVADTREQAADAAEAIAIDYDVQPAVIGSRVAASKDAARVWPDRPDNIVFDGAHGDEAATDKAFAHAAHTVELTLVNPRVVTNYLDTRATIAEYDKETGRFTVTLGSQGSHSVRDILCKHILKIPNEQMRVVTPDVGGGFGTRLFTYREYALAAIAARELDQPVKWVSDRNEHFLACAQGRDNLTTARLALDRNGKILALKVDTLADLGAYLSAYAPYVPFGGAGMLPGVYNVPVCHLRVRGVFTNTVPVDAYRGAGRPEAAYVIERLMDVAARDLGLEPDELRRRNFIQPSAMPHKTQTGKVYDSGEFDAHLRRAQDVIGIDGFKARLAESKQNGKLRGIGYATYIEACGMVGPETARLKLDADGGVTLAIGSQSTGQGHATAYAQAIADHLDLPPERVRVFQGDTDMIPTGLGTGGSSSVTAAGVSVERAAKTLADNLKSLGADTLEASVGDLEIIDGAIRVAGTDKIVSFSELATQHGNTPEKLKAEGAFQPPGPTYPNGTHMVEVEIDPDTGSVDIQTYVIVDDFGATLNPLLLEGQVVGGSVQGIGQALMEEGIYDPDTGQLMTATLMDYALPRALSSPAFQFETRNVPCKTNPMGLKGAGEAGAIGSCPALMNAIVDALWRAHKIRHIDMPATPQRIWNTLQEARRQHTL